jgi:ABC-type multidrug transport system fused ATPase/permease subunit
MGGERRSVEEEKLSRAYDVTLLRDLWPFIRPYRGALAAAVLLVMAITFLDLALPYVTKTPSTGTCPRGGPGPFRVPRRRETGRQVPRVSIADRAAEFVDRFPRSFRREGNEAQDFPGVAAGSPGRTSRPPEGRPAVRPVMSLLFLRT